MGQKSILISGAGIAGPVLAYWLDRAGASVTIVERAASLRSSGQGIDIRGAAVDVIRQMGVEDDIRRMTTTEEGVSFIGSDGRDWAVFKTTGSTESQSFTSEFEILRGDLARVFYDMTKDRIKYIFGDSIKEVREVGDAVEVDFAGETPTASFDAVVAADGQGSKLRSMVFDVTPDQCYKSLGQYMAYFTLPKDLLNGDKIAKWYNAPGRRLVFLRPNRRGQLQALLGVCTTSPEAASAASAGIDAQKAFLRKTFHNAGWLSEPVLAAMEHADDFYYQLIAQVKMDKWARGRVALVGDAAYCPTPISGMGTSLAIVGAYILAGEMAKRLDDLPAAFQSYQEVLTPYVVQCQKLVPGTPAIVNPQTQWGITILYSILWFVSWARLDQLASRIGAIPAFSQERFVVPKYGWER
ncbi:hypothetical protein MMC11_004596 [Xylographa trunciseda]|nr:hypothetical protein [Xylographa trunciseda]